MMAPVTSQAPLDSPLGSDEVLARAVILTGDGAAEHELCRRFAPRVRAYGLRHLRSEDLAAELVQRVLLLMLEKLRTGAVRNPERLASFVLGTARNVARALRRDGARHESLAALPDAVAGWVGPTERIATEALAGCLEALTPRARTVVTLTYYQESSAADIAAALKMSEGNVRVVRHRAIAALRECLRVSAEGAEL